MIFGMPRLTRPVAHPCTIQQALPQTASGPLEAARSSPIQTQAGVLQTFLCQLLHNSLRPFNVKCKSISEINFHPIQLPRQESSSSRKFLAPVLHAIMPLRRTINTKGRAEDPNIPPPGGQKP